MVKFMDKKFLKEVAIKYKGLIQPPYDLMMDLEGFDTICAFADSFGGSSVYVPSLRTIFSECLEKDMLEQYNGANVRYLVRKYGFTERHIRDLLKREKLD